MFECLMLFICNTITNATTTANNNYNDNSKVE